MYSSLPPSVPRLRWDPWARHQTPNCSTGAAAIWLPTALGVCSRCVCVFTTVCVYLDGLNAEHKFRVWVTTSLHTKTKCQNCELTFCSAELYFISWSEYIFSQFEKISQICKIKTRNHEIKSCNYLFILNGFPYIHSLEGTAQKMF